MIHDIMTTDELERYGYWGMLQLIIFQQLGRVTRFVCWRETAPW